jgi:hypothetical protein
VSNVLDRVKDLFRKGFGRMDSAASGPRRDPPFAGHSNPRDIDDVPPERAAELAGHPTERVET